MIDQTKALIKDVLKPQLHIMGKDIELLSVEADGRIKVQVKGRFGNCPTDNTVVENLIISTIQRHLPNISKVTIVVQAVNDELIQEGLKILRCERANQIGIKYCGGCNPHINRSRIVDQLKECLPEGNRLVINPQSMCKSVVLICGCPVACADRPEIRDIADKWIIVSGNMVDSIEVPEELLPSVITEKLLALVLDDNTSNNIKR